MVGSASNQPKPAAARRAAFHPECQVSGMLQQAIVNCATRVRLPQVNRLTRREQLVLAILLGLFIVGWTVKAWRQAQASDAAVEVMEH